MDWGFFAAIALLMGVVFYVNGPTVRALWRAAACTLGVIVVTLIGTLAESWLRELSPKLLAQCDVGSVVVSIGFLSLLTFALELKGSWRRVSFGAITVLFVFTITKWRGVLLETVIASEALRRGVANVWLVAALGGFAAFLLVAGQTIRLSWTHREVKLTHRTYRHAVACSIAAGLGGASFLWFGSQVLAVGVTIFAMVPYVRGITKLSLVGAVLNIALALGVYAALKGVTTEGPRILAMVAVFCLIYGLFYVGTAAPSGDLKPIADRRA